jgi:hypothetical protein
MSRENVRVDDLFLEGDDGLMLGAEMDGAPPRPAKDYGIYSLAWLARVLPILRTSDRLAVALLLYRQCLLRRSRTIDPSNNEAGKLGIGRMTKYRALVLLQEAGAVTIETNNGRSIRVTLHWFP